MSQDMMQALSGSSLMSLSVGTLPAVKSGMMLDANPFASQLALMTGPQVAPSDAGVAGAALPGAADGSFAAALALVPAPATGTQTTPEGVAGDIPALPEDASPSQILEAVLTGTLAPASTAPGAKPAPASFGGAPGPEQIEPRPMPEAVTLDTLDTLDTPADPAAARPRRAGKIDAPVAAASDATPVAAPIVEPATPAPVQPEALAPETGSTRTAIGTQPLVAPQATPTGDTDQNGSGAKDIASAPAAQAAALEQASAPAAAATIQPLMQPQRAAMPAPRAGGSGTGQRFTTSAAQSARPEQALGAKFELSDAAVRSVRAASGLHSPGAGLSEMVPPSWAAALNAVAPQVTGQAAQGLTPPLDNATAQGAPLETLAFDAGFVGNVETQIERVLGGGQMVRMQMMPEHLGRIDIEMLAGPERDQVRIVTEHDAVRDTLVQSQVRLEQDLRNGSQRAADVTVELRQQSPGTQGGSAQQQRGQSGQDAGPGRDALTRRSAGDTTPETTLAQRRARGNVRYA